ncbi:MAG TPA: PAS domain-containing protein [Cyclobacteriaceae bacterium]|nr:PAS domain-containing protein [Cyclobacteriaceae bacterium]
MPGSQKPHEKQLPGFARFLLDNHLQELTSEALRMSKDMDVPVLRYLKIPDEELMRLALPGYSALLQAFIDGTTEEVITRTVALWKSNQLPVIEKHQIVAEDISLVARLRRKVFHAFLPRYTADPGKILAIIDEIEDYLLRYTTETFRTYTNILQERIEKHMDEFRTSDRQFRQAQAVTHIGSYVWDLKAKTLTWSDELWRIYELDPKTSQMNSEIARTYNHPDDNIIVDTNIPRALETGEPFNFYYRIVFDGGREKTLHARGEIEYDANGTASKIFGTAQDVTEQKMIEQRLEENQNFVQKIADAAPAIITSYHLKTGKYQFVSFGLKKVLGYSPQEALDKGVPFFVDLMHPDDLAPIMEQNAQAVLEANKNAGDQQEEPVVEFLYRMRHANGEYRWFHTFGTVFSRNAAGEVENVLNISLDITEKIKAEQILVEKTTELEQSNKSLEEFAFIASHDLKEPLRKISTLTDRLVSLENVNLSPDGKVYLQKVVSSSLRMQRMIDELLSLAQVTSDRSYQKVSLQSLLAEVLPTFEQKIEETHAKLTVSDLPHAVVVPSQFRQLFQNLISNSLKFSQPGIPPQVDIRHEYLSAASVAHHNLQPANRYFQITFSDNGIGFDNRFLEKIFSIFQRLHPRHKYEGTGIGLSICKKIVENHGGIILADGAVDKGATFTIIVPDRLV